MKLDESVRSKSTERNPMPMSMSQTPCKEPTLFTPNQNDNDKVSPVNSILSNAYSTESSSR